MIDPLISLAFSLYSLPGAYALLLGSGISRSAQIPTGWEVILDLTRQIAHLEGAGDVDDPAQWYTNRFGALPNYSHLLEQIAPGPAARQQLLKGYFEPTDDERARGSKVPTAAHHAIARLVASGHIRVILTTNFDRLLEQAIEAAGVVPTVISTTDAAVGALPLQHTRCAIIKLHGDYLDPRIRNTDSELATYDPPMDRLLDRVLDDYGLIVCGWSGEWDEALRAGLERCSNRRFPTYWMSRGAPVHRAAHLVTLRSAQVITITGADNAFTDLTAKVDALVAHHRPHPLSVTLAVESLKQYLPEERHRIRLHDLVMDEVVRCQAVIVDETKFPVGRKGFATEDAFSAELLRQVQSYETLCEILIALFVHGCFWSEPQHDALWVKALERLAQPTEVSGSYASGLLELRRYPALLMLYAGGIAALAGGRYHTLAALLTRPQVRERYERREAPLAMALYPMKVFSDGVGKRLPKMERHYTPVSDWLFTVLRASLASYITDDHTYTCLFDRFEYLLALVYADIEEQAEHRQHYWGPVGSFAWRDRHQPQYGIAIAVQKELEAQGAEWPLLQAGLFGGSLERLQAVKIGFDALIARGTAGWW
ncbi:MAG: SIR2 family protein [Chloroflexales bacterium]